MKIWKHIYVNIQILLQLLKILTWISGIYFQLYDTIFHPIFKAWIKTNSKLISNYEFHLSFQWISKIDFNLYLQLKCSPAILYMYINLNFQIYQFCNQLKFLKIHYLIEISNLNIWHQIYKNNLNCQLKPKKMWNRNFRVEKA